VTIRATTRQDPATERHFGVAQRQTPWTVGSPGNLEHRTYNENYETRGDFRTQERAALASQALANRVEAGRARQNFRSQGYSVVVGPGGTAHHEGPLSRDWRQEKAYGSQTRPWKGITPQEILAQRGL
jgi:hypothetical protein